MGDDERIAEIRQCYLGAGQAYPVSVDIEFLLRVIERLRGVVDLLPKTADGIVVNRPMRGFGLYNGTVQSVELDADGRANMMLQDGFGRLVLRAVRVSDCYGTREAASAARVNETALKLQAYTPVLPHIPSAEAGKEKACRK